MKILYLCHRLPNAPDKGCKIRAYHELRALAKDHEVHVRSLVDRAEHVDGAAALRGFCRSVEAFPVHRPTAWLRCAVGLPRRSPATLAFFHSAALARCCADLARAESFDLVVIYSTAMMPYAAPFAGTPRVLDMVDVDSAKWAQYARLGRFALRPGYRLEATRLRRYEAAVAREVERVVLVTQHEKDLLEAVAPAALPSRGAAASAA